MTDSIIFDLDGTLWDSSEAVAASWQSTLRRHYDPSAVLTPSDIAAIMGMTSVQISTALFGAYGEKAYEVTTRCLDEECAYILQHECRLYPGLDETLRMLSATHKLFIVSNCQAGYIRCFLEYTGFHKYFTDYIEQSSTGLSKGENIRLLTDRHAPLSPVYIGDTASDKSAAEFAGIPFIYASYGFGNLTDEKHFISSLADIPAVIATL